MPLRRPPIGEQRLAEILVVGVMALWAANFIVVKAAVAIVPPVAFAFLRFSLAGAALMIVCRVREGSVRIPPRDLVPIAGLGILGFGVYQMLWTTALQWTTAGTSSLIVAATPIFTMLIASAIGTDTFTPGRGLGALLAFVGVAVVIEAGAGLAVDGRLLGEGMTLLAALLWACYMAFSAPFLRRYSPLRTTSWTILAGSLALLPLGGWQLARIDLAAVGPAAVTAILYSGLVAGALSNVIVFRGVQLLGPTRITNLQFLVPAIAVLLGAITLGEPLQVAQLAGGAVIVAGIVIARRDVRRMPAVELIEPS